MPKNRTIFLCDEKTTEKNDKGGAIFLCRGRGLAGAINLPCTKVRRRDNFFDKNSKKPCINTGNRV